MPLAGCKSNFVVIFASAFKIPFLGAPFLWQNFCSHESGWKTGICMKSYASKIITSFLCQRHFSLAWGCVSAKCHSWNRTKEASKDHIRLLDILTTETTTRNVGKMSLVEFIILGVNQCQDAELPCPFTIPPASVGKIRWRVKKMILPIKNAGLSAVAEKWS